MAVREYHNKTHISRIRENPAKAVEHSFVHISKIKVDRLMIWIDRLEQNGSPFIRVLWSVIKGRQHREGALE